jgi:hypothetical protein
MKPLNVAFAVMTVASLGSCVAIAGAERTALLPTGPVRIATTEPGVVPPGSELVVRTNDNVSTRTAFRSTVYEGSVEEDIVDQNGAVLIPRGSPVELVVRSFPYLGPGGVGMTDLELRVQAVTINNVRYSVRTETDVPSAGGLRDHDNAVRIVGGREAVERVLTNGSRINVPANTLLAFQLEDPLRLKGYQRSAIASRESR